jgi:hypothetical protein
MVLILQINGNGTLKQNDKIPGINFNSKRVLIVQAFEEALRFGFSLRSQRLFNELILLFM